MKFELKGYVERIKPAENLHQLVVRDSETKEKWVLYTGDNVSLSTLLICQKNKFLMRIRGWVRQDKDYVYFRISSYDVLDTRYVPVRF